MLMCSPGHLDLQWSKMSDDDDPPVFTALPDDDVWVAPLAAKAALEDARWEQMDRRLRDRR